MKRLGSGTKQWGNLMVLAKAGPRGLIHFPRALGPDHRAERRIGMEDVMKTPNIRTSFMMLILAISFLFSQSTVLAGNEILGEVRISPAGKVEKLAGVWVDGQYVGYVGELRGSKRLLLLPGDHQLTFRYSGYREFSEKISVEPGKRQEVNIRLEKETPVLSSQETSRIKLAVQPERAAVFLNGGYVGHVNEFNGPGQWMILPSGSYDLKITLPGYKPFEAQITLRPGQKFEVKTDLFPGSIKDAGPLLEQQPARLSEAQSPVSK